MECAGKPKIEGFDPIGELAGISQQTSNASKPSEDSIPQVLPENLAGLAFLVSQGSAALRFAYSERKDCSLGFNKKIVMPRNLFPDRPTHFVHSKMKETCGTDCLRKRVSISPTRALPIGGFGLFHENDSSGEEFSGKQKQQKPSTSTQREPIRIVTSPISCASLLSPLAKHSISLESTKTAAQRQRYTPLRVIRSGPRTPCLTGAETECDSSCADHRKCLNFSSVTAESYPFCTHLACSPSFDGISRESLLPGAAHLAQDVDSIDEPIRRNRSLSVDSGPIYF
jgi:hypothetical protein